MEVEIVGDDGNTQPCITRVDTHLAQDLAENSGQDGGQDEADQHQTDPVHGAGDDGGGTLGNGILGGLFGGNGNCGCSEDHFVNRYELAMQNELASKDSKIALLESNIYVDSKIADVYERLNTKISGVEAQICQQNVVNTQVAANLSCLTNTVNMLSGLTKTIIPIDNICPPPMERYNSWVAPTASATGA